MYGEKNMKLFENYSIKRDIYEAEDVYLKNVYQFETYNIADDSIISYNGYYLLEDKIHITLPNKEKKEVKCLFVFFNIDKEKEIKNKNINGVEEVSLERRGYYYPDVNTIQINIPFERNRKNVFPFYCVLRKYEYLETLKHELTHAYNHFMELGGKKIKDFPSSYQDKMFNLKYSTETRINNERLFYDLIYWLWDKDEFNAWIHNDNKDKTKKEDKINHKDKISLWLKVLDTYEDEEFWNEIKDIFCSIIIKEKDIRKISRMKSLDFKKFFLDKSYELFDKFIKKKARDEIQSRYAEDGRIIIFNDIKEQLKDFDKYHRKTFRTSFYSFKKTELIPFDIVLDYDELTAYIEYGNIEEKIQDCEKFISRLLENKITDKDIEMFSNQVYNTAQYDLSILNEAYNRMIYRERKNIDWNCEYDDITMEELDEMEKYCYDF